MTFNISFYFSRNKEIGEKLFKLSCTLLFVYGFLVCFKLDFKMTYDVMIQLSSNIYSAPLLRFLPYMIGTMTAIYLHKNDYQLTISKVSFNFNFTKVENVY